MPGTLYLVATPIGNLQDITFRALETLRSVDIIACEDTRHTRNLLNHFKISAKLVSYHEHNEIERSEELSRLLSGGRSVAIVSDAGTPGICDPSYRIVQKAIGIGANIIPIPGAAAFVNAVVVSGLATDSIFFGGFLPAKKGERRKRLEEVRDILATLVFYETPHRLVKSLADCHDVLGNRNAIVARELTKVHEEIVRGGLRELSDTYSKTTVKGEIVLVIERAKVSIVKRETSPKNIDSRVKEFEKQGLDARAALKKAAKEFGLSKSEAYRLIKVKSEKGQK